MIYPSLDEFLSYSKKGNLIPIYREMPDDLDTPVSAFFKVAQGRPYSFLLESVAGEEKIAQFSFLARDPAMVIRAKGQEFELTEIKGGVAQKTNPSITGSPFDYVRGIMRRYKFVNVKGLPRFCGGLVGYLGYDMVRFFERLPNKPTDDLMLPDMVLMLAEDFIIFDHRDHKIKIVSCVFVPDGMTKDDKVQAYTRAVGKIDALVADMEKPLDMPTKTSAGSTMNKLSVHHAMTPKKYKDMVAQGKKYIKAGDIIQVVLSQRLEVDLDIPPFQIYRRLRTLNPSPYMYYLNLDDIQIVGSSPELLVRCENGVIETRPIAGTRPRGKTPEEEEKLKKDLLADPKERAEHIMLVDLGRNDLGRVCRQGTVQVSEFMTVEKYSHVMHIVSNVEGVLAKGRDSFDVLAAAFPAGTLSGAPKIRAMEIIDELENVSRGPYGGAIGYFSFSGNLDTCITIRTIVVKNGKAYIQAGAGIVADSDPATEYQETLNKARAQIQAIESAYQKLG